MEIQQQTILQQRYCQEDLVSIFFVVVFQSTVASKKKTQQMLQNRMLTQLTLQCKSKLATEAFPLKNVIIKYFYIWITGLSALRHGKYLVRHSHIVQNYREKNSTPGIADTSVDFKGLDRPSRSESSSLSDSSITGATLEEKLQLMIY